MERFVIFFHKTYPFFIGCLVSGILFWLNIDYRIPNFEKVLDNATIFSSIVVGFLGALLGILVSIKDAEIVATIFETEEKHTLKSYFNETFLLGIIVVLFSSLMQVLRSYENSTTLIMFHLWVLISIWFIPSTYRIVNILMSVFFKVNNSKSRPEDDDSKLTETDSKEIKSFLSKPR
ncbi:hypothetical protein ACFSCZ_19895 [Siminovitchia sediminis]|uniref:Uncharacterized protein n=1 Tax=Siminovitchia sediminis TaxID=1274353 RepID=A0ABW4KLR7_9BACI